MAPYLGVAEAARDCAVELARKAPRPETALLVGELENELTAARLAFASMVDNAAQLRLRARGRPRQLRAGRQDPARPRRHRHGGEGHGRLGGGSSYFRRTGIERLLRDVHGAPYHPMPEKRQQLVTGRLALGMDPLSGG